MSVSANLTLLLQHLLQFLWVICDTFIATNAHFLLINNAEMLYFDKSGSAAQSLLLISLIMAFELWERQILRENHQAYKIAVILTAIYHSFAAVYLL